MKRTLLLGTAAILAVSALVLRNSSVERARLPRGEEEALGERRDNPHDRAWFDWVRFHDPATGRVPEHVRSRELAFADGVARRTPETQRNYAVSTWTHRGLWNLGGRTRALAVDQSDQSGHTLLAGGMSGGMWRTVDEGTHWTLTSAATDLYAPSCIAQDTRTGHLATFYVGTGEYIGSSASQPGASYFGTGIWKSIDSGQSWSLLAATDPGSATAFDSAFDFVWNVAVDPSNSAQEEVYAATVGGVQRSADGGQSWSFVRGGINTQVYATQTDVVVTSAGVVYAALDNSSPQGEVPSAGIWRSTDGQSFTQLTPPGLPSKYARIKLGLAPSNPNVLWVLVTPADQGGHKLYKYTFVSGDGSGAGGSWTDRSSQLTGLPVASEQNNWTFDSQGGYDMVMKVKPDNENVVFIGGVNLIRSNDGFQTAGARFWAGGWLYPDPNGASYEQHSDQHCLEFNPTDSNVAYSGSDGGVWKTTAVTAATVRWESLNNGYLTTQFYHVSLDEATAGSPELLSGLQDNGCWSVHAAPGTTPWLEQFGGDGCFTAIANGATVGGNVFVSSQYAFVYRLTLNSSGQFTGFKRIDPASLTDSNVLFVNPFLLDPNDSGRMYLASFNGLWRNNDVDGPAGGNPNEESDQGWTQVTNRANEIVTAIAASKTPANQVYFSTYDLNASPRVPHVYKLTNAGTAPAGTSAQDVTGGNFPQGYVTAISVDPTDANKVLLAFSNYRVASLFYTTNGGTNWTDVEGNLAGDEGPSVRSVLILPTNGGNVFFAGTSTGLYSTSSLNGAGTTWTQEGSGEIRNLIVNWLAARALDGTVVAATHGGGVLTATVSGSSQVCATRAGDANGNNSIDATDLAAIMGHILELNPLSPQAVLCADVADDDVINVLDLIKVVRLILGLPAPEARPSVADGAAVRWSHAQSARGMSMELAGPVAGAEIALQLPHGAKLIDAPTVEGIDVDALQWNEVGERVVLVISPSTERFAPAERTIRIELAIDGLGGKAPAVDRVIAGDALGNALALEEWDGTARSSDEVTLLSLGPNPMRGEVTLRYRLASARGLRAGVFDLNGREIRRLDAAGAAGEGELRWDGRDASGRDVASGTYFLRLVAGRGTISRSIVVLR